MSTITIYIFLRGEGTDVWRPVEAVPVGSTYYRIVSENGAPDDERWEFTTGEVVRCETRRLSGGECLVAVARIAAT